MRWKRTRSRTIFDVAVLALCVSLGVAGSVLRDRFTASIPRQAMADFRADGTPSPDHHLPWLRGTSPAAYRVATDLTPFLAAASLGLWVATRPRRRGRWAWWRRSGRGAVGVTVAATLAVGWLLSFLAQREFSTGRDSTIFAFFWDGLGRWTSQGVVGAWLLMAILGRWRTGRGWRERLARLVGWGWAAEVGFRAISTAFGP